MSLSVLITVTHLLGVGHLTRSAALGRALARAGHRVTLVSGGRPADLVDTAGLEFVQLPPVHCEGTDFTRLLSEAGTPIDDALRAERIRRLLAAFEHAAPDVVITETYPFGRRALRGEFRALLDAATARTPRPAILASIRDILNPPSRPQKAADAEAILRVFYDGVLVHGDEAAAPLALSWPVGTALERQLVYTGYLGGDALSDDAAPTSSGEIVVSGGGSAAGLALFEAAAGAADLDTSAHHWRILVGQGVPESAFDMLRERAVNAIVERARPDFRRLLAAAEVSVSQAGYNTALDLAATGARAVLVPFEQGAEQEQRLRAEGLAAARRATLLPERDLTPAALLDAVAREAAKPHPVASASLDGGARAVRAVEQAAHERRRVEAAWDALARCLDDLQAAGRRATLWWRDDDAAEPTPALDRLIALSRTSGMPLALAVSPGLATDALATRLAAEPGVHVLVHGLAHENRAPAGAKKCELGHRPIDALTRDLAQALLDQQDRFGRQALAVLVPPWNRVDDALEPHLAAIGFRGLSTFKPRAASHRDGLAIINTHCDPIDWRGGGGLADEAALVETLTRDLGSGEPIGLLTHHLVHDERLWRFVERLVRLLAAHPAVDRPAADRLFGPASALPPAGEAP
ncbi:glycosyltransferase [Aureimonas pseudogalii]|uniref:Putative glycosyltransferase n=1 Tax=Aureimonas pseudogalii TaxID=1744844 RepID=A0A7W6EDS4_9HYPH|nr:glycosyltransferase [Aureimonas pseudogalii]MBB3996358.1 putative glycosyltransferase [Aureimonas pseudogalii]